MSNDNAWADLANLVVQVLEILTSWSGCARVGIGFWCVYTYGAVTKKLAVRALLDCSKLNIDGHVDSEPSL
jgi:hypothetical protein